jgi:P-type E1-E2 ATPase
VLIVEIPGGPRLELAFLVMDLNGTLSDRGLLVDGVAERLSRLAQDLELHLLTADTLGTANKLADELEVKVEIVSGGADKAAFVRRLGAERTVAIGNGRNDVPMLGLAALGIAVLGAEGAATAAIVSANVVCRTILEALDLLLDPRLLIATLRP